MLPASRSGKTRTLARPATSPGSFTFLAATAGDSAASSKNTSALINQTIEMINTSTEKSATAAIKLEEISRAGKATAVKVNKISEASNNQATSIAQIRQSINLINDVVQQNSATAEESAASGEELMGQMQMLKQLVDSFEYTKA